MFDDYDYGGELVFYLTVLLSVLLCEWLLNTIMCIHEALLLWQQCTCINNNSSTDGETPVANVDCGTGFTCE